MPRYVTNRPATMREVYIPLPATAHMPYAAMPYLGPAVMQAMPGGGARLRIQAPVQKVVRDPNRYAPNVPREAGRWRRRCLQSWLSSRGTRPQTLAPHGLRPTQQTGNLRPMGGRRFRVVR